MQPVAPCNSYHAVRAGTDIFCGADGKSVFKVYFFDIIGRDDPSKYVWAECGRTKKDFMARLAESGGVEGVGFITAFPHITKVFRFDPAAETVINVRACNTPDMSKFPLERDEGYVQFACLAEAAIAMDEFRFWAEADNVEEYLQRRSDYADAPVKRHDKLLAYWKT